MNFNDFTFQRNVIFDDFPDLFRYQFWHWFLMRFGIDFVSILGAFCNYFSCFFDIGFCICFCIDFWLIFDGKVSKNASQKLSGDTPFLLPKSTLASKAIFGSILVALPLPFGILMFFRHRFLHRFLIDFLVEKWSKNVPKTSLATHPFCFKNRPWRPRRFLDPFWSPCRSLLASFGSLLAPLGFLAPFWFPLASFWFSFSFFGLPFGRFWLAFGSRLLSFGTPSSPFWNFRLRAYKFFKKTHSIRHPKPQSTSFAFLLISETNFCRKIFFGTISARIRR